MGKQQGAKADAGKPCASSRAQTVKKHPGLKVVSLFSGCGGLDLGLKQAGHETILLCEKDPDAIQVLKKNFPGVKLETDVCTLKELPKVNRADFVSFLFIM